MPAKLPPASHTVLSALPVIVLDVETTGLDVRRDRIVQVGAVAMLGQRILDEPRLDQLIDPGVPIPASATRIHGLTDIDVAGAPRFADFAQTLRELVSGHVVVGHNIGFDLAVLRHEAARAGVRWHDPPALDVGQLVGALEPALPDLGLETVASLLGVTIDGRHRALGDALATARAFSNLLPRLREADVRTLGEAQSFAASRADLALREAEAGWLARPGEIAGAPSRPPLTRIDSYIFERRVSNLMSAPPVTIAAGTTLREAARIMTERRIGALLVGAAGAPPEGILTERDLLRAVAGGRLQLDAATVLEAMTAPVETVDEREMLYRALGRMQRLGIRHLCVVDETGAALGMISQRDLLRHRASAADVLGDALAQAHDASSLAAAYSQVPEAAARLLAEDLDGAEIARVVSNELCGVTARAAQITLARLEAAGRGTAPAPWCLLVLGSGGRGESLLGADQDNALIHSGAPADDAWFAELGAGIAALLDEAGVPRCKGGVMAANAQWRGTLGQWHMRVDRWLRRARPEDLLNVDIFFDLMPVAGEVSLGSTLHADAVRAASRTPTFIALLAEWVGTLGPGLGLFGRLRTDAGRIDLKRGGLMPLVNIARTLALRAGSTARSTPERLRDAAAAGRLPEGDAASLIGIHSELLTLVLRQQLLDLQDGVRPSSCVQTRQLARQEIRRLRAHLQRLDEVLRTLRGAVAG
jgi:signal-transduction protein with cAMP-binding, CBS, and nucleotidyltransferase domain/DNA polymerase III epsilon subunit-like protein